MIELLPEQTWRSVYPEPISDRRFSGLRPGDLDDVCSGEPALGCGDLDDGDLDDGHVDDRDLDDRDVDDRDLDDCLVGGSHLGFGDLDDRDVDDRDVDDSDLDDFERRNLDDERRVRGEPDLRRVHQPA